MEVTSASRSNNRLLHSASSNFSVAGDSQVSNFELLLDLPTAFACCPTPTEENLPPESSTVEQTSDTVASSDKSSTEDAPKSDSDEDKDRLSDSVAAELAVIQSPIPVQEDIAPTDGQDELTGQSKIEADTPVVSAKATDTPVAEKIAQTRNTAQRMQAKQDRPVDAEPAANEQAVTEADLEQPKPEVAVVSSQQAGLSRDANKKVPAADAKDGQADEPTLQTDSPTRLTANRETSENGAQENTSQESQDQLKNEKAQPVTVEQDRRDDSRDRPARWYERESAQQQSESKAVEIAAAKSDAKDAPLVGASSDVAASANESLASGATSISQTDSLATEIPASLIPNADATVSASTAASTSSTVAASGVTALESIDSESASSAIRPGFSTEQKLAHKATGVPGNNLESSQTSQQVDISRAEKVRLAQRVARSFSRVGPTGGSVQLKLHPPELGSLAVNIKIEGKSMSAKLTTESQAAREVIMESLPQLRTRLAEQGYDVVQFTVDVASESATTDNQGSTGQGTGQSGAGQGGQSGSYESGSRSLPGTDLRRSNYLRRQMDAASQVARPTLGSFSSRSIDVQA